MTYYTGIGSRALPPLVAAQFKDYSKALAQLGFTLRSGAAKGADEAFEIGCDSVNGKKEIYLPWKNFNKSTSTLYDVTSEALEIAGEIYGSRWKHSKEYTKKYMARNMYQVTGMQLDKPSKFVICWTPDGVETQEDRTASTGGTGQAIAYADLLGIPVFNLKNKGRSVELLEFIVEECTIDIPTDLD